MADTTVTSQDPSNQLKKIIGRTSNLTCKLYAVQGMLTALMAVESEALGDSEILIGISLFAEDLHTQASQILSELDAFSGEVKS